MPKINVDNIHANFVRQLESWVDALPGDAKDEPFVSAAAKGGKDLTPKQVLVHVRKLTPLGVRLMEQAAALAMSDFVRNTFPAAGATAARTVLATRGRQKGAPKELVAKLETRKRAHEGEA